MSLKSRFFTILTVAGATVALSTIGYAEDNSKPTGDPATKVERPNRGDHGFGRGEMGGPGKHRGGRGMRHGGGMGMGMMFHDLNLTDAQKTQIQSIMASNKPSQENREEMRTLRMAARTGTLTTAQQERFTAIREAGKEKAKGIHEQIMGVLTAEQKATIEKRKADMKVRMQERKQKWQQKAADAPKPTN